MLDPNVMVEKAKHSAFHLRLLNWSLGRMIPFNKPHRFRIIEIGDYHVKARIPYSRRNFNHIRGLHACALATISEFATGFLLITRLNPKQYRLIMKRLEMDYHFQGKMDATASFAISEEWMSNTIFQPLKEEEAVVVLCEVKIHDAQGNLLTTGKVHWQIKDWTKVRTKA